MKNRLLCVLLAAAVAGFGAGCSNGQSSSSGVSSAPSSAPTSSKVEQLGGDAQFHKFDQPVTVHIGMSVDPTDKTLPAGDSADNNQYTRYLKDNYNIVVKADWTAASGSNFDQKVSLCIASSNLPDAVVVSNRTYMTKAAGSGLLYDITDLFQQYQSKQVKEYMEKSKGQAMENASYDGRMYSLPNITCDADGVIEMLIRQDWLDKLKLPVPKTVGDIEKTAKAFLQNKVAGENTIGIAGPSKDSNLYCDFLDSSNLVGGFDPIFAAYDAYPGYWLNNNGTISYGTLSPNTKKALEVLAGWYKEGLIDPQAGTRDNVGDPINANQVGIVFGPWWEIGYGNGDSFKNDPTANWQAYPVYTDDGKWNVHMKTTGTSYTIINKNASEDVVKAIIIMNNALVRDEAIFDTKVAVGWYPLRNVMAPSDEVEHTYTECLKVLQGKADPEDYNEKENTYKILYTDAKKCKQLIKGPFDKPLGIGNFDQKTDWGEFQRLYSVMVGDRPFATIKPDKTVYSAVYSQTEGMQSKWANLWKLEKAEMLKIVVGKEPVSSFDNFVQQWKAEGGDQITAEVQEVAKK